MLFQRIVHFQAELRNLPRFDVFIFSGRASARFLSDCGSETADCRRGHMWTGENGKRPSIDSGSISGHRLAFLMQMAIAGLIILLSSNGAWAQAVYGSIFGTITDSSGAVVPNATVTVT